MRRAIFFLALALVICIPASATTLTGSQTADNGFFAFISTDDTVLGTQFAEGWDWGSTWSFSAVVLTPGVTNYLHIEMMNWGGAGAHIGDFTLSDTGFHFANGTQYLTTETTDWTGIFNNYNSGMSVQPWMQPIGGVYAVAGNCGGPWGCRGGIDGSAIWILPNGVPPDLNGGNYTVDFSTPIYPAQITPEPGTMLMLGTGLVGVFGLIRRKLTL